MYLWRWGDFERSEDEPAQSVTGKRSEGECRCKEVRKNGGEDCVDKCRDKDGRSMDGEVVDCLENEERRMSTFFRR